MHSGELNHSQLAILRARIAPAISFLRNLHDRMKDKGFAWNDRLRIRVVVALDALEQLNECLVQLSRTRGGAVGLPPWTQGSALEAAGTGIAGGRYQP